MSRNVRRKAAPPPQRISRRDSSSSSSSLDLSSDGGYSAVEEVSDSDDDDEDGVNAVEEQHIISDVATTRHSRNAPRPNASESDEDSDDDDDEDDDNLIEVRGEDDENDEADEEDDDEEEEEDDDDDDDNASWNGIVTESEVNDTAAVEQPKRQVRFTGVPDSDSDSDSTTTDLSDAAAEFFPDIFVSQNSLDPAFRQEIENESDSTVSSSYWDYAATHDEYVDIASRSASLLSRNAESAPAGAVEGSATPHGATSVADGEQDGYESDGDTTADEEPELLPSRENLPRRVQPLDDSSDSDTVSQRTVRRRQGHPRVGRFTMNADESVAVMHPVTGNMIIFTPERSQTYDVFAEPLPSALDLLPPNSDIVQSSPIMSNSASVMMGAMFSSQTFGDYVNSQSVGPVEAFFPSLSSDGIFGEESDLSGDFIEDDGEFNLRLEDFIQFERPIPEIPEGSDAAGLQSETDGNAALITEDDGDVTTPGATTPGGSHPFTAASSPGAGDNEDESEGTLPPLLAHFDKNVDAVGAFRRNQIDKQLIFSNKATAESLAFSGPYYMGTLRGIKSGSLEAVTTPLTPPRRRKHHSMSGHRNDFMHSAGESVLQQKRKATGTEHLDGPSGSQGHKKQRSISEVKDLAL